MADFKRRIDELYRMSPTERLEAYRERIVTDLNEVPEAILDRFYAKAQRIAAAGQ